MELSPLASFKNRYLELIARGYTESKALVELKTEWLDFFELCAKDADFRKDIDNARKARAEVWINNIVESATSEEEMSSNDIAREKLRFDQLKFLAGADNPDRYGTTAKSAKAQIDINLNDFKLLPPSEAIKVLNNDPFNKLVTIDAEVVSDEEEEQEN